MNPSTYMEDIYDIKFSPEDTATINDNATFVTFPANSITIHEGDKSVHLHIILKGIIRGVYIDEAGNDISKCFSAEKEVFSAEGLRTNGSSSFTIETLEECHCIKLTYEAIRTVMSRNSSFKDIVNQKYLNELAKLEKRSKDLVILRAEERYNNFCKENADLVSRIPLKHIASYIGIRPASLSRIRKSSK